MNTDSSSVPPVIGSVQSITYTITRGDLFHAWLTVVFRNRILQVFVIGVTVLNFFLTLPPDFGSMSLLRKFTQVLAFSIIFGGLMFVFQFVLSMAHVFLANHKGVLGEHHIQLLDGGLMERTEYNETLHKYPSVCRILSGGRYLYIYVSDHNAHQVPKRCFAPGVIETFERELRNRVAQTVQKT